MFIYTCRHTKGYACVCVCVCVCVCARVRAHLLNKYLKNTSYGPGLAKSTVLMNNKNRISAFMVWKGIDGKQINKSVNTQLYIMVSAVERIRPSLRVKVELSVGASLKKWPSTEIWKVQRRHPRVPSQSSSGAENVKCKDPEGTSLRTRNTEQSLTSTLLERLADLQPPSFQC